MRIFLYNETTKITYELSLDRPEWQPPSQVTFKDVPYHLVATALASPGFGGEARYSNADEVA